MKILILGSNGQVAWELKNSCASLGTVISAGSDQVNFLDSKKLSDYIFEVKPSHIVNAAAYTAVDKAESEVQTAEQINGHALGVIGETAKKLGASVVHYSTDYVFDGTKTSAYEETDTPNPINAYGRSKLMGEKFLRESCPDSVVMRVSWVYGNRGQNFLNTMLRLGAEREELRVVADQLGAPTWCRDIAKATGQVLQSKSLKNQGGIYHFVPTGETSWHGFATSIFDSYRKIQKNNPLKIQQVSSIKTHEYPTPAKRPMNSRMDSRLFTSTFGVAVPHWEESLKSVLTER